MGINVGTISANAGLNIKGFTGKLSTMYKQGDKTASSIEKRFKEIGDSFVSTGKMLTTRLTAPLLALGGASVKAYDTQIQAEQRLAAALRTSGEEVNNNLADFKAFASNLQSITTVGDESTLGMIQVAKSMGLTNDQAKRAAKNSIGLAKAMGMSEQSAIRYTSALESGESTMLARYIPALRQIDDKSARAAKAQELLANMFSAAESEAKNGLGPLKQMWNTLGDFSEQIGEIVLDRLQPFIKAIGKTVDWLKGLDKQTKGIIVTVGTLAAGIGPVLIGVGSLIKLLPLLTAGFAALTSPISISIGAIAAFAAIGAHVYKNWDAVKEQMNYLWLNMKNAVVEFVADTIEVLTKLYSYIPGVGVAIGKATGWIRSFKSEIPDSSDVAKFESWGSTMNSVLDGVIGMFGSAKQKIKADTEAIVSAGQKAMNATSNGGGTGNTFSSDIDMGGNVQSVGISPEQLDVASGKLTKVKGQIQQTKLATMQAAKAGNQWASSIGNSLSQTVFQGKKLLGTIKDMIKQFAKKIFIKGITAVLSGGTSLAGGGLVGSLFGGLFHGGGIVPGSGERMIRAQGGEGVFTPSQMAAIGNMTPSGSSAGVERQLERIERRLANLHLGINNDALYLATQKGRRGY